MMSPDMIISVVALGFGWFLAIVIFAYISRFVRQALDPRFQQAAEAGRLLKEATGIVAYHEVGLLDRDIHLVCLKDELSAIQSRKNEIRRALQSFPDTLLIEERHGEPVIVLIKPGGGEKREKRRAAAQFRMSLE